MGNTAATGEKIVPRFEAGGVGGIVAAVLGDRRQANQMTQKWESGRLQLSWRHAMDLRFALGEHRAEIPFQYPAIEQHARHAGCGKQIDRKSTRLNSSH